MGFDCGDGWRNCGEGFFWEDFEGFVVRWIVSFNDDILEKKYYFLSIDLECGRLLG